MKGLLWLPLIKEMWRIKVSVLNNVECKNIDMDTDVYPGMIKKLKNKYFYHHSVDSDDITTLSDMVDLYHITKPFYEQEYKSVVENYVPLYQSLWKLRLKDVSTIDNMHQDGGVHYFSNNGYDSRMITIWTNIHKDKIPSLEDSDMGLFIVENNGPVNTRLYQQLASENTHFMKISDTELMDNMYVAGPKIDVHFNKLNRTYYNYKEGTSICFNSHLLHGSKTYLHSLENFSKEELNMNRVSLTSVWIHKDDLNMDVVSMNEDDYQNLYLKKVDSDMWDDIKEVFPKACKDEQNRITQIKKLINVEILQSV